MSTNHRSEQARENAVPLLPASLRLRGRRVRRLRQAEGLTGPARAVQARLDRQDKKDGVGPLQSLYS